MSSSAQAIIMDGLPTTYANLLLWNEREWRYDEVVDCVKGRDATAEIRAMHSQLCIVLKVRVF